MNSVKPDPHTINSLIYALWSGELKLSDLVKTAQRTMGVEEPDILSLLSGFFRVVADLPPPPLEAGEGSVNTHMPGCTPFAHGFSEAHAIRMPQRSKETDIPNSVDQDYAQRVGFKGTRHAEAGEGKHTLDVCGTLVEYEPDDDNRSNDKGHPPRLDRVFVDVLENELKGLRIAFSSNPAWGTAPLKADAAVVERSAVALSNMGHTLVDDAPSFDLGHLSHAMKAACDLGQTAWIAVNKATQVGTRETNHDEQVMWRLFKTSMTLKTSEAFAVVWTEFQNCSHYVAASFKHYDVLVLPIGRDEVPITNVWEQNADLPSRHWWDRLMSITSETPFWNVTGQPTLTVLLDADTNGQPIGVHLVGRIGAEAQVRRVASELKHALPLQDGPQAMSARAKDA